jgi:hypothetical protein
VNHVANLVQNHVASLVMYHVMFLAELQVVMVDLVEETYAG